MNIIVTGGAGFIGSAVIRHILANTSHSVINIDKLTYAGHLETLSDISDTDRYFFEHVDICDAQALARIFNQYQPSLVMHLAAESHVDRSISGPSSFIQTNIVGTFNLLETSREYLQDKPSREFRFHHISTDEVYGDLKNSSSFFTEDSSYSPSSPYSASKASSDHLVRAWGRTYNLPIVISNCSNNYGPYQHPEKLIPLTITNALKGEKLPVYGSGLQVRDWLYVNDHASALYTIATKGLNGSTYMIGADEQKTNIEIVTTICQILEKEHPTKPQSIKKYTDLITYVNDRPGHDLRYAVNASKLKRDLNWKPKESLSSGLEKTVRWYMDNHAWCASVIHRNQ